MSQQNQKYESYQLGLLPAYKGDHEGFVWNFAFGANMNPLSFTQRRGIKPVQSLPGKIDNVQLTFDIKGFAFFEPAFGNIQFKEGCQIHGVLHKITIEEFHHLQKTEGGGGQPGIGYYPVLLPAQTYDGQVIMAWALKSYPSTECNPVQLGILPSNRYLKLLKDGSRISRLDSSYIDYLETIKGHKNNISHYFITTFIGIFLFPFGLIFFLLNNVCKISSVRPFISAKVFPNLAKCIWAIRNCLPDYFKYSNDPKDLNIPEFKIIQNQTNNDTLEQLNK